MRTQRRERTEKVYIYGKHALMEALQNTPHIIRKAFLSSEAMNDQELRFLLKKHSIPTDPMKTQEAARMVGRDTSHQGVIATADTSKLMVSFGEFAANLEFSDKTMLVVLDELTDPHNVGAIIRSAAAFGAAGVLIPPHNQAPLTGAVVKASVGMVFRVPIVAIGNVNQALDVLQRKGFRAYALAMEGSAELGETKFDAPTVFVVGNEGRGVRQKTMERADVTLRIPMHPRCESLNASVSAAVVLYAWSVQHPEAMK